MRAFITLLALSTAAIAGPVSRDLLGGVVGPVLGGVVGPVLGGVVPPVLDGVAGAVKAVLDLINGAVDGVPVVLNCRCPSDLTGAGGSNITPEGVTAYYQCQYNAGSCQWNVRPCSSLFCAAVGAGRQVDVRLVADSDG
jgi:hypothetical protein